ncbi:MAG TPA: type II toxin-antitoxin system VapC family toxin [Thermoleophilia bacterium]|nr:type II toxin-antitoxin system VapC family toxin [Thermoleophilia bacterium]
MVLDTSVIVAILLGQAEAAALHQLLVVQSPSLVGSPTLAEAGIVLQGRIGQTGLAALRGFLVEYDVHAVPFGEEHWRLAAQAFGRFGKGRHPAGLNFGDCLTYATAKLAARPLLCVGDDFAQTDLELVPPPS